MSQTLLLLLIKATWQTLYMVITASIFAGIIGIPLGILLVVTGKRGFLHHPWLHQSLALMINAMRSIPFIILLVAITPFTRLITGTSIGTTAAIVPLCVGAIPFVARIIETALHEVPLGLIEAGKAMGASAKQIIFNIMLPEAMPAIIEGITVVVVSLIGYSAMAGAIGGGGLGEVAINYGYQRFDVGIMLMTVVLLIILVQLIQYCGDQFSKYLRNR
jgi:D-methionine transport system permease protein